MGFDIYITLSMMMCNKTGKPFYHGTDPVTGRFAAIYGYPDTVVPENLRKYLIGRGHLFGAYTKQLELDELGFNVGVDQFLGNYPSWEDVMNHEEFRDDELEYWNEDDHENFQKLLKWCVASGLDYHVTWSY